ncbi:FtsK/SpoIIIE family DNA translocase [Sphingomonas morindae]|uniref:DNA translocase FtsK n=1 Tax=Sphingomonas morindae TaxID=1541170 RepID=A0ABY4XBF3_9SPHN|nr:DNA translocase FtsK 4TM domain-containing protein [Sphingomonas morindae]USI74305.1 DNA translocase FtsK 4TM domain-containing protein [Sphingomonas morindae]
MAGKTPAWRERAGAAAARGGAAALGATIIGLALLFAAALASYARTDPAINTAAGGPITNWIGTPGALAADAALTLFGPAALALIPIMLVPGLRLMRGRDSGRWGRALLLTLVAMALAGTAAALFHDQTSLVLPAGWGGALGLGGASLIGRGIAALGGAGMAAPLRWAAILLTGLGGLGLWLKAIGLEADERDWLARAGIASARPLARVARRGGRGGAAWEGEADADMADGADLPWAEDDEEPDEADTSRPAPAIRPARDAAKPAAKPPVIAERGPATATRRTDGERQSSLDLRDKYRLPPLDLLAPVPESSGPAIDKAALERNARLLETVLDDFHVKGNIVEVRPGPVVTMYELEPAPGIKASRVIALADDIARNMSALSARVATIAGRTVIGIELPNARREAVMLSELVASQAYADHAAQLPIILGKNIQGDPVIADLAPMPHLLVAGTTGSGKSVGLNCMILSLLYRLTPDQCRMIMIDPKMLELSIYDDIPHLLSPVVTEPAKAVRALKWAVEQMEERYRMMASVGVRSLASFNDKVRLAKAKGQRLGRRVQTGYDAESGHPLYEEEELDFEALPQIVVIVDELADLMMTAGKEVEFLIQRLAQKARAAGIHLIMATQRPSVDVITGVIKANLPTRISFSVTSKIDSRTILGEQGAEQLLGKGDMLYMPGGKQIARVHGPFVSDEEVRAIADHWRGQGKPDYISAVTEEPEDGGFALDGAPADDDSPDAALYRKAVQVVAESQKASTSYVQRQLRIGYNSAARLIERMEREGKVGSPDHVGRREVLIDRDGQSV